MTTPFETLKLQVSEFKSEYVELSEVPHLKYVRVNDIPHVELMKKDGTLFTAEIDIYGLEYLSYRLKAEKENRALSKQKVCSYEEYVAMLETMWENSRPNKRFIAAIINGKISSFMNNYIPVLHKDIVGMIEAEKLQSSVSFFTLSKHKLDIYLALVLRAKLVAGVKVTNGHDGRVSFNYRSFFQTANYEFSLKLESMNKHLSRVFTSLTGLKAVLDKVAEIRIDEKLRELKIDAVKIIIDVLFPEEKRTKRQNTLLTNQYLWASSSNALDFAITLVELSNQTKGYKSACKTILDSLIEYALSSDSATKV